MSNHTTTTTPSSSSLEGGCTCGQVRYALLARPLFTHCCHCRWCQRETGSSYALNALIETSNVQLLNPTKPEIVHTPSASGKGQNIARCPTCRVAVWSNYGGGTADIVRFIRVGTLDTPDAIVPDIHIYTSTKQPWVKLDVNGRVPIVDEYYDRNTYWPKESLERRQKMMSQSNL